MSNVFESSINDLNQCLKKMKKSDHITDMHLGGHESTNFHKLADICSEYTKEYNRILKQYHND